MHRGPFIITASGKQFHYWPINQDAIDIVDIARALSNTCRYNGHLPEGVHYSVAQHSSIVATIVSKELISRFGPLAHFDDDFRKIIKAALLHDAPEAYMADLPGPLKGGYSAEYVKKDKPPKFLTKGVESYREYEDLLYAAIAAKFGVDTEVPDLVNHVDKNIVLPLEWYRFKAESINEATEGKNILPVPAKKYIDMEWEPKSAEEAEQEFLELFYSIENSVVVETDSEDGPELAPA